MTKTAVMGITNITQTIERINQIQGSIALAVGQQNAATLEISRNVQEASMGTTQVSVTIQEVTRASGETGTAAESVLQSAEELTKKSGILREEVDKFLVSIRR